MTEFLGFRPKTYSYLTDNGSEDRKAKQTKKCVIKQIFKFSNYKNCLLNNETIFESEKRFKSESHNVYTEEINQTKLHHIHLVQAL